MALSDTDQEHAGTVAWIQTQEGEVTDLQRRQNEYLQEISRMSASKHDQEHEDECCGVGSQEKLMRKCTRSQDNLGQEEVSPKEVAISQEECGSTSRENVERDAVSQNRQEIMLATISAWKKEDIYITKTVKAVKELILSKNCVCAIGLPGAGKSTALHHAALSLEREGFTVYFISGPDEFLDYYETGKKQVFVIDDPLGVYSVSQDKVDSWQEHSGKIRKALSTNAKLLVSIRTQIFKHESIKDSNIVFLNKSSTTENIDFSEVEYEIGITEMRSMLSHYMTTNGVDVDNINKVIKQIWPKNEMEIAELSEKKRQHDKLRFSVGVDFTKCFPLLCRVFVNTEFVRKNPIAFFKQPFHALTKVFQKIKSENKHQFCALVLCTIFDGKLTKDMFRPLREAKQDDICDTKEILTEHEMEIRDFIMSTYNLKSPDDLQDLKTAFNSLTGVYISNIGNTYRISHALFNDVVIYLYNDPIFIFKYGTSAFIQDRVRINDSPLHDPYVIVCSDDKNIQRLADRLIRDFICDPKNNDVFIVCNPNIDDDRLLSCMKTKMDREQIDKILINTLLLRCMKIMLRFKRTYRNGEVPFYKIIQFCVQLGADCNMHVLYGWYPIYISVASGSLELTKLFLQYGADKRRVLGGDQSILHLICTYTKYNKLELIKLLTQHKSDQSVLRGWTLSRRRIMAEFARKNENLHVRLEEVLSDNSIKILTTDKDETNKYVKDYEGKIQLVKCLHDNILAYADNKNRNILHYSVDDIDVTRYLLTYQQIREVINHRDDEGKTPYWYVVNKKIPYKKKIPIDVNAMDIPGMLQLYEGNNAIL